MLVALIKEYDQNPFILSEPGFGLDGWDLAAKAGIIPVEKVEEYRQAFFSGYPSDIPERLYVNKCESRTSQPGLVANILSRKLSMLR